MQGPLFHTSLFKLPYVNCLPSNLSPWKAALAIELISSIADVLNLNDPEIDNYTLYKYSNELASIFETINANIQILSDLKTRLDSLDSEIITLLLNVENSS